MNIEIDKYNNGLNIWIELAKQYSDCFNEPDSDNTETTNTNNQEQSNRFLKNVLQDNTILFTYDKKEQIKADSLMSSLLQETIGDLTYVLDCEENSIFTNESLYVYKRYSDIRSAFDLLESIEEEAKQDGIERYIFINSFLEYYVLSDSCRFIDDIKKLSKAQRIHIICITSIFRGLTQDIVSIFSTHLSCWIGSLEGSNLLFGSDIACSQIMEWEVFYKNKETPATIQDFICDDEESTNNLLDI